jgi:hypothetical protein
VNYKGPALFSLEALDLIFHYSSGIPRRINLLCENALLIGYALNAKEIKENIVAEAVRDLSWGRFTGLVVRDPSMPLKRGTTVLKDTPFLKRLSLAACLVEVCLVLGVVFLMINSRPGLLRSTPDSASVVVEPDKKKPNSGIEQLPSMAALEPETRKGAHTEAGSFTACVWEAMRKCPRPRPAWRALRNTGSRAASSRDMENRAEAGRV